MMYKENYFAHTILFFAVLCGTTLFTGSTLFAQGPAKPAITNVPGGLFIQWPVPIDVAEIQLGTDLSGPYEVMLNLPSAEIANELISKKPEPAANPDLVTVLANYWLVRQKAEKAIPLYENCLKQGNLDEAKTLMFKNNLAMIHSQELGQHDKALELINSALETQKDNVTLLDSKGLILMNNSNPSEAVQPLQRAVELSCQNPLYCLHLAYALHQEGRDSQSRRYIDPVRDQLIPAVPTMSKENKAMFDKLQLALPPEGTQ